MSISRLSCPACGKLMAVGAELAGKKVRCPHCRAVVTAPTAADEIAFNLPAPQEEDSILAEPAVDDVFGMAAPTPRPEIPASEEVRGEFSFGTTSGQNSSPASHDVAAPEQQEDSAGPLVERRPIDAGRGQRLAIAILVPYAVLMTVLAAIYFYKARNIEASHPLSNIPDLEGEYRNASQKKRAGIEIRRRFSPNQELYASQITELNKPIVVGDLEVIPLKIEQGPLVGYSLKKTAKMPIKSPPTSKDGLILTLRLTNVSKDVTFYPTDPYFVRRPRDENDRPYTLVEVGSKWFYGGALEYVTDSDTVIREWLLGQEHDHEPLHPGETRETVVCTSPREGVIEAVRTASEPAVWRVQLRRGFTKYQGREYSVSCVIGVRFSAGDIVNYVKPAGAPVSGSI